MVRKVKRTAGSVRGFEQNRPNSVSGVDVGDKKRKEDLSNALASFGRKRKTTARRVGRSKS